MNKGLVFLESIIKHIEYYKDRYYNDIYTYSVYWEISEKEKFNIIRKELEHKKELERENKILKDGLKTVLKEAGIVIEDYVDELNDYPDVKAMLEVLKNE